MTSIGLFGVIAYVVSQRTHEIGVRMALGARRSDVLKMVISQGLRITGIGLVIGLAAAWRQHGFSSRCCKELVRTIRPRWRRWQWD